MRIGMFAKLNNLSIDTIRYYVDLILIHPIRKGRYYYFDKEQQVQLDKLLYLKKLRFTLEEIKKIVTTQQLSKIKTTIESNIYEDMLLKKKDALSIEITELSGVLNELESEIKRIKEKQNDTYKERGIAFKNLELICCPKCGKEIEITEGILKGNGIYEGISECSCGYSLSINQGIIVIKHNGENIIEPYVDNHNYIETSNYDEVILYEGDNINDFFLKGDKVNTKIMVFDRTDLQ